MPLSAAVYLALDNSTGGRNSRVKQSALGRHVTGRTVGDARGVTLVLGTAVCSNHWLAGKAGGMRPTSGMLLFYLRPVEICKLVP